METQISDEKEDRYTRLKAIRQFGYDISWESLRQKSVTIAGVGGLGIISSEMLARCGIGTIYIFDYDIVEAVNLNRVGFMEADIGVPKVKVVEQRLIEINPDVNIIAVHGDIMMWGIDDQFDEAVSKSDLVLMGLDNYPARSFCNQKCINHKKLLIDAGVSRSALSGNVHPIFPGKSACMMCTARLKGTNEKKERGEACTASLPTTMAIIASLQVQEALKYMLNLGTLVDYQTYNALTGEFRNFITSRDPKCPACSDLE
ncbi:ThiF family adenylyltransferase [Candidatus Lokiarchaeum ossiferum]|uniref:ThiF family adenylyltransferase n=1 Tax=Candidatus Lokiarchaeum ossiferum TaxID=2951803 RepID=UPI00352D0B8F